MAFSFSSAKKVTLKLLIDRTSERVLFAEAGKEFIDFLCNLLLLPVGTVIRLLKDVGMVGSLGTLYNTIENLNDAYMQSSYKKSMILEPKSASSGLVSPLSQPKVNDSSSSRSAPYSGAPGYLSCSAHGGTVFISSPGRNKETTKEEGYVKDGFIYMVMDNLAVQPMSPISCLTLINSFHVKNVSDLEEKVIEMGTDEGIKLVKASLQSKTVLTDVFLR